LHASIDRPKARGYWDESEALERSRKQIMLLIEEKAWGLGLKSIGLHIFGYNSLKSGRHLFDSV
jgi:hypothetical protein